MKRIFGLVVALAAAALGTEALAFTAGNIVILRVGDGTQILTNVGNSVFLDEYTTNDIWNAATNFTSLTPVGTTIMMPTNWVGAQAPLIMSGVATGQGVLNRSVDGRFLVLTGYGATLGQFTNASLSSTTTTGVFNQVARVVGLVDGNGHIYTGTTQTNQNEDGEEPRAAVSLDGTNIWLAGDTTGTKYLLGGRASMTSTQVGTSANTRGLGIFSNTLYYSANHVLGAPTNTSASVNLFAGTSLPTSFVKSNFLLLAGVYGNSITSSPAQGSPFGFTLLNMSGGSTPDTLYVADNVTNAPGEPVGKAGGVIKYCYIPASNAWVGEGYIYADQAYSVTGVKNGNNATLYITAGGTMTGNALNRLYPYNDVSGFGGSPQTNPDGGNANTHVIFLTAGANPTTENTRGIAFAPVGGDPGTLSSASGVISVGPPFGPYFRGAAGGPFNTPTNTYTYSVANLGNTTTNFNVALVGFGTVSFASLSSASGTLAPGASTLITVTPSPAAATAPASGTPYTGNIVFRTGTLTASASIKATLVVDAFFVTPASNYTAVGSAGGPFTPPTQVYTISNATPSARGWAITNAVNWYTISATNGSLAATSTTNITITINANANSLPLGLYSDNLVFNDTNSNSQITSHFVNLQVGFGFFDDFSTNYVNGPIVGQNSWYNPTSGFDDDPYQIVNGVLVLPDVNNNCSDASLQEPAKSISSSVVTDANQFVYLGISMTVTSAYPNPATWDFAMVPFLFGGTVTSNKGRTSVNDVGGGHYAWNTHVNGFDAFIHGTTQRNYNQKYNVYIVGDVGNSNSWVFVDPPSADTNVLFAMTPDAHDGPAVAGWGGPSTGGIGGIDIDHFCSANTQAGYLITRIAMSTNYADVYNFLTNTNAAPPSDPFTVWQNTYFTAGELADPTFSGPDVDPDHDGVSNTNEFLAGFNPTNNGAYPHIISIVKQGGGMNVTYLGANGDNTWSPGWASRTNVLEYSTGVPGSGVYSNNFTSTGQTNILSGGNGTGQITNMVDPNGATGSTRYYRIRVIAP